MKTPSLVIIVLAFVGFAFAGVQPIHATTITVQSTGDGAATVGNCPGVGCRLRDALAAASDGGGIYNDRVTLTINNSTVSGNSANRGGGIFNNGAYPGGALTRINNSTISGNVGEGIYNDGATGPTPSTPGFAALTVSSCTVSG